VDFVEICNFCARKVIIKAAKSKRIFDSDKICRSYCDFYFGVTFFGTHCITRLSDFQYEEILAKWYFLQSKQEETEDLSEVSASETFDD